MNRKKILNIFLYIFYCLADVGNYYVFCTACSNFTCIIDYYQCCGFLFLNFIFPTFNSFSCILCTHILGSMQNIEN